MAELLLRGKLTDEARSHSQNIKKAGSNLISLINDILDFSKIEAGKLEIIPANYMLSSLMNDTVSIIRMRLMEKPISFDTNIDGNIPNNLVGDEVRMRQILLNLLSNAVKYTDKGKIAMSVNIEKHADNKIWLRIDISDTGRGIKPDDKTKLFGDYVQVDTEKNRGIEGTGLGLAITRRLCLAMGGDISVESEYGTGSTFTAIIPQGVDAALPSASETGQEKTDNPVHKAQLTFPGARFLVVDDIATNLMIAEALLEPYNAKVDTCQSGTEAVELVKRQDYDIVFMDHMMPEMDGIEATTIIRAWEKEQAEINSENSSKDETHRNPRKRIPIIALTANAMSGMNELFAGKGFNDFLSKPIDISGLDEMLDKWMPKEKKGIRDKGSATEDLEKKLVLLVDDNPAYLRLGKNVLSEKYRVATAPSAAKLFDLLIDNHPAIILLDTDLPEMDGFQALKILKSKPETKEIPVILLSETADSATGEKGIAMGAANHILKAFDSELLITCIEKHT
jgi:CheY-like chemotaxis protein/anti-sigma regulatory factor (Ser/Thr protein kinase)